MQTYHLVTHWRFSAPVERVWEELSHVSRWPSWWQTWRKASYRGPESQTVPTSIIDNEVKGKLAYSLRFTTTVTRLEAPFLLEFTSSGDTVGTGRLVLEPCEDGTAVVHTWDVATSNPVFNLMGKFAFVRKMIEENHAFVMEDGYRALKRRLES